MIVLANYRNTKCDGHLWHHQLLHKNTVFWLEEMLTKDKIIMLFQIVDFINCFVGNIDFAYHFKRGLVDGLLDVVMPMIDCFFVLVSWIYFNSIYLKYNNTRIPGFFGYFGRADRPR